MLNLLSFEEKYEDDMLEISIDNEEELLSAGDEKCLTECLDQVAVISPLRESSDSSLASSQLPGQDLNAEVDGKFFEGNSQIEEIKERELGSSMQNNHNDLFDDSMRNKQSEGNFSDVVEPHVQHCQHGKSEPPAR